MHPGVLECAAVGVPDEHSGEAVKLFVVKRDPSLTEEAVSEYCKRAADRLQAPEVHRVPHRAAEDQRGQDPAPRAEREEDGVTRLLKEMCAPALVTPDTRW